MPNYEYQCTKCNHVFEIWQSVGEAAPQCPECGSDVKKVFHPPRVIFKGSGFYVTDLRAEKSSAGGKESDAASESGTSGDSGSSSSGSESISGSGSGSTSKTDAAPAPKTDSGSGAAASKPV